LGTLELLLTGGTLRFAVFNPSKGCNPLAWFDEKVASGRTVAGPQDRQIRGSEEGTAVGGGGATAKLNSGVGENCRQAAVQAHER